MELPQALRDNYLFRGLSDAHIDEILALATTRTFLGGDTIPVTISADTPRFRRALVTWSA